VKPAPRASAGEVIEQSAQIVCQLDLNDIGLCLFFTAADLATEEKHLVGRRARTAPDGGGR
jgi:hypothetical protein